MDNAFSPQRVLVKICGTTSVEDAQLAERAGADFLGAIVEHAPSPRNVSSEQARSIFAATSLSCVAVTVNKSLDELLRIHDGLQPYALQLHGDESPDIAHELSARKIRVWAACSGDIQNIKQRVTQMTNAGAEAVLLDARISHDNGVIYGGTGLRSDWKLARELVESGFQVILAGGLSPENVAEAVATVRPWAIDTVSGVEADKGIKDAQRVLDFVKLASDA